MMNLSYSKKVMKHFRGPHNYGSIKNPDGVGEVGNLVCGDVMKLYIKVDKKKNTIKDVKFETLGCVAAIATSSVVTDMAKGKTIENALKINNKNVVDQLDTLPPVKIHCSLLAADALAEAIYDYYTKNKIVIPDSLEKTHKRIRTGQETLRHTHTI
jgi:nitrogen fixation NifU-like protein